MTFAEYIKYRYPKLNVQIRENQQSWGDIEFAMKQTVGVQGWISAEALSDEYRYDADISRAVEQLQTEAVQAFGLSDWRDEAVKREVDQSLAEERLRIRRLITDRTRTLSMNLNDTYITGVLQQIINKI